MVNDKFIYNGYIYNWWIYNGILRWANLWQTGLWQDGVITGCVYVIHTHTHIYIYIYIYIFVCIPSSSPLAVCEGSSGRWRDGLHSSTLSRVRRWTLSP
jgi:hypothetical protein